MILLVDISFLLHQSRATLPPVETKKQIQTGLLYGVLNSLQELMREMATNKVILCIDSKRSLRKEIYPAYKGKRNNSLSEQEIEFKNKVTSQFPKVIKLLQEIGFQGYMFDGYEADDIMASITRFNDKKFILITPDHDMYQLLDNKRVTQYSPQQKAWMSEKILKEKMGITPLQFAMLKALAGCKSDNVSGIMGIGEKGAISYMLDKMNPSSKAYAKIKTAFEDGEVGLYTKLVALPFENTPVISLKKTKFKYSYKTFEKICKKRKLKSFMKKKKYWKKLFNGDLNVEDKNDLGM